MKNRIKILYTIPNFKTAGSQYVLLSLFNKIERNDFDPYICIEKFTETIPTNIPKEKRLLFRWNENKIQNLFGFKRLLKDYNFDIVHSWDYKSNYFEALACRIAGVKYIYTKKNNAWSKRWQVKSILATNIAYDNPAMKERFFKNYFLFNKVTFIPHGVDINIFKPMEKVKHSDFNIGCIGNIGENKNQLFIIESLKKLPDNIVLHLYGNEEAEYRQKINEYVKKNRLENRIHFHGFIENHKIPKVFQSLDLFILTSINEGLPVSILEALACGVPVLSSDSGGGARYLLPSQNIFSLTKPDELVEKILQLYHSDERAKNEITNRALQNIAKNHTLEMEVTAYERLYKKIMKIDT